MKPRVLLDVDGPLTRGFFELACELLCEHGIIEAHPDRITQYDICASFNTSPEIEVKVYRTLRGPAIARYFSPNEGARAFVAWLQERAEVYAVTVPLAHSPTWASERTAWLEDLGIPSERIILGSAKHLISGDVMVDDNPTYLEAWAKEHPAGLAILWREPHNAACMWRGPSVAGYTDLKAYLEGLLDERT